MFTGWGSRLYSWELHHNIGELYNLLAFLVSWYQQQWWLQEEFTIILQPIMWFRINFTTSHVIQNKFHNQSCDSEYISQPVMWLRCLIFPDSYQLCFLIKFIVLCDYYLFFYNVTRELILYSFYQCLIDWLIDRWLPKSSGKYFSAYSGALKPMNYTYLSVTQG